MKNRIRSFTVIEMLVVMLISALSIGITYTCYTIFSNRYLSYKKSSDELSGFILMDKLLTKDVSSSMRIERTHEGMMCCLKAETIRYEFSDSYVLRRGMIVDTFPVEFVMEPDFRSFGRKEDLPGELLEEIHFETVYKEEKLFFHYKKNYGADILINMDEAGKR